MMPATASMGYVIDQFNQMADANISTAAQQVGRMRCNCILEFEMHSLIAANPMKWEKWSYF